MTVPALEIERCYAQCEQITRREAANFYYGIRLLPRDRRDAICAVYAFARRVDDIGDRAIGDGGDGVRDAQLRALRDQRAVVARLDDVDDESLDDPVRVALAHARRHYALPLDAIELLVEGVELDVLGVSSCETFDELVAYCRRVAGTIGRLCTAIFTDGRASSSDFQLADDLGVAMQLTNILRDVREDALLDRFYLPAEDLRRFGCEQLPATLRGERSLNGATADAVSLILFEAERANQWFERGMGLLHSLDTRSAACLHAMTGIYRTLLDRIIGDPAQVLDHRVTLNGFEKGLVAARSLVRARPGREAGARR